MAAYSVNRRMKELGIRIALGARNVQLMNAAIGRPILLLCAGSGLGLVAGNFRHRLAEADCVSGESRRPGSPGWRSLYDGLAGLCRVSNSGAASTLHRPV